MACADLPPEHKVDNYDDAEGAVTVCTPHVVPWAPLTDATRRLNYGKQLDEGELLKAIHGRQARAFRLQHSALQIMASLSQKAKLPEETEGEESTVETESETETDSSSKRKHPALADDGINEKLVELLSPLMKGDYSLAPDDAATLIAAYKTYMINLEEYYNLSTVGSTTWGGGSYRPYKVHMTRATAVDLFNGLLEGTMGCLHADPFRRGDSHQQQAPFLLVC
ncbi:MAG TPA: hypothetical protein PKA37_17270 [Planctomycetota bacterium]|nr:hypothetical protein [Planctomycetota bacterium]